MKIIILILTLTLSNQLFAKDKIYKWTDADGNVHYSQNKPQNIEVKEVKVRTGKSKPKKIEQYTDKTEDGTQNVAEVKSEDQQAVDEYNKNEQDRVAKLQNQENCKVAKKNLATLQQTRRVRKVDATTGESIHMDDTQRLAALKAAKNLVSGVCK